MSKQTAVEWFASEIAGDLSQSYGPRLQGIFEQALAMEREQMIEFADNYVDNCVLPNENMAIPTTMDVPNYYEQHLWKGGKP